MLAGYLPFDDDPANPEGDNINLLYKYITTTALTFPEYVTPHARDLLRRILVPDPRKRADLFEVARHSWLSEYHHVVSHITSSTTNIADIANSTVPSGKLPQNAARLLLTRIEEQEEAPALARSASVREPVKATTQSTPSPVGQLSYKSKIPSEAEKESSSRRRNVNRHTIQPEYVAPQSHTSRGDAPAATTATTAGSSMAPVSPPATGSGVPSPAIKSKPLPQDPSSAEAVKVADYPNAAVNQNRPLPSRPVREVPRSTSDSTGAFTATASQPQAPSARSQPVRPSTGNAALSPVTSRTDPRLPSRGSYGQPVAPTVEAANAQGRVTQPNGKAYNVGQPTRTQSINRVTAPARTDGVTEQAPPAKAHHRRTSTLSGLGEKLFGRSGSILGRKDDKKKERKYPPTSMKESYSDNPPRPSMDSKRSFSFGLGKKKSADLEAQSQQQMEEKPKRFSSILPPSFSFRGMSSREPDLEAEAGSSQGNDFSRPATGGTVGRPNTQSRPNTGQYRAQSSGNQSQKGPYTAQDAQDRSKPQLINFSRPPQPQPQQPQPPSSRASNDVYGGTGIYGGTPSSYKAQAGPTAYSQSPPPPRPYGSAKQTPPPRLSSDNVARPATQGRPARGVLHKNNRNFNAAYEYDQAPNRHEGSSGPARKVMDYFRRRKAKADGYQ